MKIGIIIIGHMYHGNVGIHQYDPIITPIPMKELIWPALVLRAIIPNITYTIPKTMQKNNRIGVISMRSNAKTPIIKQ